MANKKHLALIKKGVKDWNLWRKQNPKIIPDLSEADLGNLDLRGINLREADLCNIDFTYTFLNDAILSKSNLINARLIETNFVRADLRHANLTTAMLHGANLRDANLHAAILTRAYLGAASFVRTNLSKADLTQADLTYCRFIEANMEETNLSNCNIYGVSAWNVILKNTIQKDLVISREDEPVITVDDMEVAQFIYLILNNAKIQTVINSITSKGVLILGRFADPQRKAVLDGLREKLRDFDLLPIVFDFDRPTDKDYTETVQTLAGLSMFVIADLTSPKSVPLELESTVKQFKIPYVPIIDISVDSRPFAMLVDLQKSFNWVLPTLKYESKEDLLDDENIKIYIIDPVIRKREELRKVKNDEPETILIRKKSSNTPLGSHNNRNQAK